MHRREVLRLASLTGVALAGCLGSDGGDQPREPVVSVGPRGYDPRKLSVDVGTTVRWVNENTTVLPRHTVTSRAFLDESTEWSFDAELPGEGAEATYTFERTGLFTYVGTIKGKHCMCGLVAVGDASYDDPLPCSPVEGEMC